MLSHMMGDTEAITEQPITWSVMTWGFSDRKDEQGYHRRLVAMSTNPLRRTLVFGVGVVTSTLVVMEVHGSSDDILRTGLLIGASLTAVLAAMTFVECVLPWVPLLTMAFPYSIVVFSFGLHLHCLLLECLV